MTIEEKPLMTYSRTWRVTSRPGVLLIGLLTVMSFPAARVSGQTIATYELLVDNFWSQASHESWAPLFSSVTDPHFSHLGGGTHNSNLSIWEDGGFSSPGMITMQETGWIDHANASVPDLKMEFDAHLAGGDAFSFLEYQQHFSPLVPATVSFDVSSTHPLVTLATMLGPTPDWFVGVSGLNMRDAGGWRNTIDVELFTYNGGTRSDDEGFLCCSTGPLENPQKAIELFLDTPNVADPLRTALTSAQIGSFTFTLQNVVPIPVEDADFDEDLHVDGADFLTWQRNLGIGSMLSQGDANSSGTVDAGDLAIWELQFGTITSPAVVASVVVPESGSIFLAAIAGLVGSFRRRRI